MGVGFLHRAPIVRVQPVAYIMSGKVGFSHPMIINGSCHQFHTMAVDTSMNVFYLAEFPIVVKSIKHRHFRIIPRIVHRKYQILISTVVLIILLRDRFHYKIIISCRS